MASTLIAVSMVAITPKAWMDVIGEYLPARIITEVAMKCGI